MRVITTEEANFLKRRFGHLIPASLLKLLSDQAVVEGYFELSPNSDASELGVDLQWMTPYEQAEEAFDVHPGIEALKYGYIPIGKCLEGSGDPYFAREENSLLKVYRIPHDAVTVVNYAVDEAKIEYVCLIDQLIFGEANGRRLEN